MAFFAAAEGVAAPEDLFDDPAVTPPGSRHAWTCVARVDPDTVVLGSQRALFCVMDMRPGQGYSVRHSWRSRPGKELVEMEFCAQMNACWALERDGHGHGHGQALELVRYDLSHDGEEPGRAAVPVSADEATHVVSPNGTVALSLPGGVVELWRGGQASSRLQQVGTLHLSPVLGINTHYQLFKHLVLVGPLLVVGVSTDVWVVQLGGFAQEPQPTGADGTDGEDEEDEEGPAVAGGTPAEAGSLVGQVENRADMLDCAVPQRHECALARPPKALVSSSSSSVDLPGCNGVDLSAAAMVVARLSFHRPRYFVSKVRLVAVGPTWVELLVVSGQAACLYRVTNVQEGTATDMAGVAPRRPSAGNARATAPVLVPLVELGFNTKVLATAKGPAAEYPWLYVLTLSGIEVWCVPPPGSPPGERSPCRLLVQRLEYRQRLDRLPPLAMLATRNALVLLANPPGHIPSSLPDMLFHTVPRPSLAHIPELSSSGPSAGAGSKRSVDGAFGIGYDLIALQSQSLAAVYQCLCKEVKRALSLGVVQEEDGMVQENQDFLATRFVEGELLDSSVYGIQPERVIHRTGAELLALLYALLRFAAAAAKEEEGVRKEGNGDELDQVLEAARKAEAQRLYNTLSKDCAALVGSLWLEPRAEGVSPDAGQAAQWFAKSRQSFEHARED